MRNRFGQERHAVAANRGYQAEERQSEPLRDVLGGLDGVVEVLDAEGQAEGDQQAGHQGGEPLPPGVGRERRARHLRVVLHRHVVRAAVADDLQFLLLREQRLPELSIALGLALKHDVVSALAIEIHRLVFLLFERRAETSLLGHGAQVLVFHGLDHTCALRGQRLTRVLDLQVDLLDFRVIRQVLRR